jgi:bifunctional DNA-binding transcriptional regulator/antitoxin component of YhaV-PrlF toxin-antitoxin module
MKCLIKIDKDNITIPKEIIDKMQLKKGDIILIEINKVYGEMPKGKKFMVF